MWKNEHLLQLFFILVTAGLVSLVAVKLYPKDLFKPRPVNAQVLIRPIPDVKVTPVVDVLHPKIPPNAITVKKFNLNLPIVPAIIVNEEWELFDDKVSWLATSQTVGEGNVILYAHNRKGLFGDLHGLEIEDEITIDQQGKVHTYIVSEKRKVKPSDIDVVLSDENRLTLYTCEGVFDENRLVIIAKPK